MADFQHITVRIADYAPVKAIIDAANEVIDAKGDAPWTLEQKIEALDETLNALTPADEGEGWEG
jgi:hypothetical protein